MKKKRKNSLIGLVEGKPCKNYVGKRQKNLLGALDRLNRERKSLKSFEKVYEHERNSSFKKLSIRISIDRKLDLISRKCFD